MHGLRSWRFPDSLVLIFGLILLAQLATYVLPAGEFEREGRQVIHGTYHAVEAAPISPLTFLTAIPVGLIDAADIIIFILVINIIIIVTNYIFRFYYFSRLQIICYFE